MRILPLLCAAALFPVDAKADKFWFGNPEKQTVEGSDPDYIQGVLIDENKTSYHIRVVGGELIVAKKRVIKVEKDGLTMNQLVEREKQERKRLTKNAERRALERAASRLRREVRAAEASAARAKKALKEANEPAPRVIIPEPGFDPVIGRVEEAPVVTMSRHQVMRELEFAWDQTGDRRYLRELRRMRRMK